MKIQEIMHNIEILDSAIEQKEQQKKLIEEEKQELLVQKQNILSTLHQFNIFNVDTIGEAISKLLTIIDKKTYVYYTAYKHIFVPEYDMFSKYLGNKEFNIPIKIILPEKYKEEVFQNDDFLKIPLFVVLDNNVEGYLNEEDLMKSIKLYNGNCFILNKIGFNNIPDDYYNIIDEFIKTIRDYRLEKNELEITEKEIIELLENYISQYKFEDVSFTKKITK